MTNKPEWVIEFDGAYLLPGYEDESLGGNYRSVKDFIASQIEKAERRGYEQALKDAIDFFCKDEKHHIHQVYQKEITFFTCEECTYSDLNEEVMRKLKDLLHQHSPTGWNGENFIKGDYRYSKGVR